MWLFLVTIWCLALCLDGNYIPRGSYKVISDSNTYYNLGNIIDHDLSTFSDVFLRTADDFSVLIELTDEIFIDSVTIKS